ncbi:hypothetical protein NDU88_006368 [Pleurodeles waltl]|uniref:Uncharacterized protein n=1 Tax=Pleurodeles waltl TaxID=8319 RepID=A0AAV7NUX5_PLEWA|nr:hypothetical protein NDU88_006368 [Pleurodeles waltl]
MNVRTLNCNDKPSLPHILFATMEMEQINTDNLSKTELQRALQGEATECRKDGHKSGPPGSPPSFGGSQKDADHLREAGKEGPEEVQVDLEEYVEKEEVLATGSELQHPE